ncbi:putative mitogen-activated protein kinase organizer 1 [Cladorrhinum sp. PSN332]|nr:putative mitogen-activated protein kinase organizer 1 [Cladorrhinum sp. PSN332]
MVQYSAEFPSRPVAQLLGSNGPIHAVTYSSTPSTYILTGSSDRSIRLYNPSTTTTTTSPSSPESSIIPTGKLIQTYSNSHAYEVLSLSISSQNDKFASSGGDRTVHLWDVSTAQTIRRFGSSSTTHSHTGRVNAVTFAGHDDSLVISGGLDCTVRIWDLKSHGSSSKPIQVLSEARDAVTSVAVGPSSNAEIVAGSVDGRVRTYDVRMGRCVTDVMPSSVTSLSMSRDGKTLLVGSLDSKIRLMDRRDGQCLKTYGGGGWKNTELRVQSCLGGKERWVVTGDELTSSSSSGEEVVVKNNEGRIWAWDLMTGKLVAKVAVPWGPDNGKRMVIGRDGKEKERKNVVSCIAWQDGGFGSQFCVGGTSGVVTVFGQP